MIKVLLFLAICFLIVNWLIESNVLENFSNFLNSSSLTILANLGKPCSATLNSGQCWKNNQPWYCDDGKLVERPDICGCPNNLRFYNNTCIFRYNCSDGTLAPDCSINKPYQCIKGELIENPQLCGCPEDYIFENATNSCRKIERCSDGTIYGQCSVTKPLFCSNGSLIEKASICGCPSDFVQNVNTCISKYETNPIMTNGIYVIRGQKGSIPFLAYGGLRDYLANKSRYVTCYSSTCPESEVLEKSIENQLTDSLQDKYLYPLVEQIKTKTTNEDDQVRIAVSYVQHIPYDWEAFNSGIIKQRYPYEVIYDNKGVCMEKARLLAYILMKLGYNVSLFEFDNHEAVGIKCPLQYSYINSGYCFIESTAPTIITDSENDYIGVGKLGYPNYIIHISGGKSFDSVDEEYNDARKFQSIVQLGKTNYYLDSYTYTQWQTLVAKYDIQVK